MSIEDDDLSGMVKLLSRRAVVSDDDREALMAISFDNRLMVAGSYLVREGEVPEHCGVLLSGIAIRHKLVQDGSRQIVSVHIPGDILDLPHLFLNRADHNVQMLSDATVARFPRRSLCALARSRPTIGHALMINVLAEGSILREWVLNVGRRDARSRIGHFLCEFSARLEVQGAAPGQGYLLPFTQEQIADAVGLTAVHVNRMMKRLTEEGLITRKSYQLDFPDWPALKHASSFDPSYLHLDQQIT